MWGMAYLSPINNNSGDHTFLREFLEVASQYDVISNIQPLPRAIKPYFIPRNNRAKKTIKHRQDLVSVKQIQVDAAIFLFIRISPISGQ